MSESEAKKCCNLVNEVSNIIIGFVQPVGTDLCGVRRNMREICGKMHVPLHFVNMTDLMSDYSGSFSNSTAKSGSTNYTDIDLKMSKGNELRSNHGNQIFSLYALAKINDILMKNESSSKVIPSVIVLDSFKHTEEISTIRKVFGQSFFLFAISSDNIDRVNHLKHHKGMSEIEAYQLIDRDKGEKDGHGQQMQKVFQNADIFLRNNTTTEEIARIIEVILGNSKISPSRSELWMHFASVAAAKSSDPSRQVGAAIVSKNGELLAVGPNEVPSPNGGLYSYEDTYDNRDVVRGFEQNHRMREVIKSGIVNDVEAVFRSQLDCVNKLSDDEKTKVISDVSKKVREKINAIEKIEQLTEYVRAVHGEMEAILSCARKGISTVDSDLYCTTFPCHNCAKHIINAGIRRVVFIEPYPKSLATFLHGDAISSGTSTFFDGKVTLEQFSGVGPRRFLDLFSTSLSNGVVQDRKGKGHDISPWETSSFSAVKASSRFFYSLEVFDKAAYDASRWLVNESIIRKEMKTDFGFSLKIWLEKLEKEQKSAAEELVKTLTAKAAEDDMHG